MLSIISEKNQLWGSSFFPKCWKFDVDVRNGEKNCENILGFGGNFIWIDFDKHSLLPRENTCHRESISYQTSSIFHILLERVFGPELVSNWWKNMTKLQPCRFGQCFGPFNMLTLHKFSDTGLFTYLSNDAFCLL